MKQAERRRGTQQKLTSAVVECLDRMGYAQTSITAVQEVAGLSRGALLHHFPSKRALIAGTARAVLNSALESTTTIHAEDASGLEEQLVAYWRSVVDTPAGRAFLEILTAARTDDDLRTAIQEVVSDWESGLTAATFERFVGRPVSASAEAVEALWGVSRAFLRGMLLETPKNPERAERRVRLFARMLADHLAQIS